MRIPIKVLLAAVSLVLGAAPLSALAEKKMDFGEVAVHYNAFTTDILQPEVAQAHNITRSRNRAMVNITTVRKVPDSLDQPVPARVRGDAVNLTGQIKNLDFREIRSGEAVYYIAVFPVAHQETLDFSVQVTPAENGGPYQVRFRQQFFTR